MSSRLVLESQQSVQSVSVAMPAGRAFPGCWTLEPGRAITLTPQEPRVLVVAHGRVWLTMQGPHSGHPQGLGDHFLQPGDWLVLAPGQAVVMEPLDANDGSVAFRWDLALPLATNPAESPWQGVVEPLSELASALAQGGRAGWRVLGACARLVAGVGRCALYLIAGQRQRTLA